MSKISISNLDRYIENQLSDIPPTEKLVRKTNPWAGAVNNIAIGLILSSIGLDLLHIQYLLPTIGVALIYVGFRSLREVNEWFRIAWLMSVAMMLLQIVFYIYDAIPWSIALDQALKPYPNPVISIIFYAFRVALILVFRQGVCIAFHVNGVKAKKDPLLLAAIWMALLGIMSLIPFSENVALSWAPSIILLVFLILILRSVLFVEKLLEEVGYTFTTTPVRFGGKTVIIAYLLVAYIIVAGACMAANHLSLNNTTVAIPQSGAVVSQLAKQGVPEDILQDLTEESIAKLIDTKKVHVIEDMMVFHQSYGSVETDTTQNQFVPKPGDTNLKVTTIFFEQLDKRVIILNYFTWIQGKAYWNDGFEMFEGSDFAESEFQLLDGRLLYKKDDTTYSADIPRLKQGSLIFQGDMGLDDWTTAGISGGVSYPFGADSQRGYVLYSIETDLPTMVASDFTYIHFENPIRLPNIQPEHSMYYGSGNRVHLSISNDPNLQ